MSTAQMKNCAKFCLIYLLAVVSSTQQASDDEKKSGALRVVTVATHDNDGFRRFERSVNKYGLSLDVLGMGQEWLGGEVEKYPGGGQKVRLLRDWLEGVKDNKDMLVLFTDSYDVVFTAGEAEILKKFSAMDSRVVFSSEGFCWPDAALAEKYPPVKPNEKRYLNSGGFIGYAPELYEIVTSSDIQNEDDDQLFYTQVFLDEASRTRLRMRLDTRGDIFQNLNGALDDVTVKFKGASSYLYNSRTGSQPVVVHGNGPIKPEFNRLTNYLGDAWTMTQGCQVCQEGKISLEGLEAGDLPRVFLALFLEHPTPFADDFFENVAKLDYPKEKIDLFVHYADAFHERDVTKFMETHAMKYNSAKMYSPQHQLNDWTARNQAVEDCLKADCQYYFSLDGEVQIEDPTVLTHLIETNRTVIAPFFGRPDKLWSNFWGALSKDGFYKRSEDYVDIVQGVKRGIWNVPYISNAVLIHGFRLQQLLGGYVNGDMDPDMALAANIRKLNVFLHVDNQREYGFLVSADNYDTSHLNNDLYQIFENQKAWEKRYIHPTYKDQLADDYTFPQPCPDVFWLKMVTPKYCWELIAEMEHYGQWSGGRDNYNDPRLDGGYENVPTVDIHMKQIGMEPAWIQFLKVYVAPINNKIFTGYFTDARAIMNFVVRYKPGEQDRLRPHHDASTFTLNIALNRVHEDYQGGGVKFHRYNCTVTELRQGWMLMHPGRLTHIHEGLPTTGGTRYIMVSFVDP